MQAITPNDTSTATLRERLARSAVVGAIGNTPLLQLTRLAASWGLPDTAEIWLKAEWTNPGGSVKDRPALAIVRGALESGQIGHGRVLIDSTSGNTGIAYAMLGAALGFPVELVVPGSASTSGSESWPPTARPSSRATPTKDRTARSGWCATLWPRPGALLLRRPVWAPVQSRRPLADDRARDLVARRTARSPTSWRASAPPAR